MNDLLTRYKQHQSDLLLNLKTIESDVHAFLNYISNAIQECNKSHTDTITVLQKQMREMDLEMAQDKLTILQYVKEIAKLQQTIDSVKSREEELLAKITNLEDENNNFRKVSRIIAFENENAALKREMESLKKRLLPAPAAVSIDEQIAEISSETIEQMMSESSAEEEDEIGVYEKTIKGEVFYISNDDNRRVYRKNEDGSIGEEIGRLAGKNKLILNCQT